METPPSGPFMDKKVQVSITKFGDGISISVDPDPVPLKVGGQHKITWEMAVGSLPGWDFDETAGIDVRNKNGKFHSPEGPKVIAKKFSWKNNADVVADYKYIINLTDGMNTYTLDPTIRNQP